MLQTSVELSLFQYDDRRFSKNGIALESDTVLFEGI